MAQPSPAEGGPTIVTQFEFRRALRAWVLEHTDAPEDGLFDDTPLIECRYLTSIQIYELLMHIGDVLGTRVDARTFTDAAFRDIDSICEIFYTAPVEAPS